MLRKLIALDMRAFARQLQWIAPIYGLLLLSALLLRGFNLPVVGVVAYVLALIGTALLIPAVLVLGIVRYYRHLYSHQGYLTHTLPVTASQRYHGKLISGSIMYAAATLMALAGVAVLMMTKGIARGDVFGKILVFFRGVESILAYLNISSFAAALFLLGVWLVIFLSTFALYSLCITAGMGRLFSRMGMGGPFIVYLLVTLINQVAGVVSFLLIPLSLRIAVAGDGIRLKIVVGFALRQLLEMGFKNQQMTFDELMTLGGGYVDFGLGSIVIGLAFIVFSYFFTKRQLAKVNLR